MCLEYQQIKFQWKNGSKFSHLHMVRAPLTVSLTVEYPFFYDFPYHHCPVVEKQNKCHNYKTRCFKNYASSKQIVTDEVLIYIFYLPHSPNPHGLLCFVSLVYNSWGVGSYQGPRGSSQQAHQASDQACNQGAQVIFRCLWLVSGCFEGQAVTCNPPWCIGDQTFQVAPGCRAPYLPPDPLPPSH